jgi:mannose-6-phosphate isomerase-like protein (cupin superfamily)
VASDEEAAMGYEAINFDKKFKLFDVAKMNDYQFKVVRLQGDFVWHDHKDTDETFIVLEGDLRIDFRDGAVHLSAGGTVILSARVAGTRCVTTFSMNSCP